MRGREQARIKDEFLGSMHFPSATCLGELKANNESCTSTTKITTCVFRVHIKELVKLDPTEGEGTERPPLLEVSSDLGVGNISVSLVPSTSTKHQRTEHKKKVRYTHHLEVSCGREG